MSSSQGRYDELSAAGLAGLGPGNDCDREPIHLSGAIQPHGLLVAIDPTTRRVEVVSGNLREWVGMRPQDALGAVLHEVVGVHVAERVAAIEASDLVEPEVTSVFVPTAAPARRRQDLTVHRSDGLLVCELEPTGAVSDDSVVGLYQAANRAVSRLHGELDIAVLCQAAVEEMRALTGYDRVMVYRFSPDAHGEVVAEAKREGAESFLGLHYPATDIPRQARLLYLRNWVRVIADVDYSPVPLLGRTPAEFDLGLAGLRSVSPVHLKYLSNMGVGATMTVSLIVDGRLWGMLACHHDSPRLISGHLRAACATFGQALSTQLRAAQEVARHAHAEQLSRHCAQVVTALAAAETLAAGAVTAQQSLIDMVDADGAVLTAGERRSTFGHVPSAAAIGLLCQALARRSGDQREIVADDGLRLLVEQELGAQIWTESGVDAHELEQVAAGALYLPLGQAPGDHLIWLRKEQARTVRWAGRHEPGDKVALTPRASFAEWCEEVSGRSRPWQPVELDSARELAQAFPELLVHRARNRLVRMALHDPLTGLPNRAMLLERLTQAMADLAEGGDPLAVMFIDLDHFKAVNDTHGHAAGDALLVALAGRLTAVLRPQDTLARLGGDEFVLLVPGVVGVEQAIGLAQRVIEQCRLAFPLTPQDVASVSASIGVALQATPGDPDDVLRRADNALYFAKRAGRDQIRVHGMEYDGESEQSRTEAELAHALTHDELVVHLQPVIRIDGPRATLHGAESLVRWQHPQRGLLGPDKFIPLAEASGQIDDVGSWVLERSLQALASWGDPRLTCAVNVSVGEVSRQGFAAAVLGRLQAHGIAPARLCLEITETQMMQRPERVAEVLAELMDCGVRIAIDDFGTGFSSMAYVRDLPAHLLKIDRTFVNGLPTNARDVAVVASIIRLAHELGMEAVAEGVETAEQLAELRRLGCDLAQGYLFGRPAPTEQFDDAAPPLPMPEPQPQPVADEVSAAG